jgi:hypothetical protein
MTRHSSRFMFLLIAAATVQMGLLAANADAAGQRARGEARASVNRADRPAGNPVRRNAGNTTVNAGNRVGNTTNINNNRNVNVNNNRDVDINVDGRGRYSYNDHYHPVATAAAVTATVAVTSAVVGSIVHANQLPPSCVQVMQGNVAYMQCGSTWYQPQYQGSAVTYVVINHP